MTRPLKILLITLILFGCATPGTNLPEHRESLERMDIPEIRLAEYIIGPGDVIAVEVWRHPDLTRSVKVQTNGAIHFPLIGTMQVHNMGLLKFQEALGNELDRFIVNPQINVQVQVAKSRKIYVLGEVLKPGVYLLEEPTTASEAIAIAGGFNHNAKRDMVLLTRKTGTGYTEPLQIDIAGIMTGEDPQGDIDLKRGDILYVPLSNIARLDRFWGHLSAALSSIIGVQQVVVNYPNFIDVLKGKDINGGDTIFVISP
jgi:polysaccharide export outer membrane protein